jgi:DNA ligase (NAD+)
MDEIKRLDLHIGDTVFIEKGGDIIPKVVSVDKSKRINSTPVITPTRCPVCGAPLEKREGKNVDVFCSNDQCPAKILNSLTYFVSRTCMNIKDVGPALLEKLLDTGAIHDLLDLYNIMPLHFEGIDGVGPKVVGKVLDNIEDSKKMPPTCLLAGMGIPLIGKNTAVRMMAAFGGWEGLWEASATKIASLPDVGMKAAENFAAWRMENPGFISSIKELGMNMVYQSTINPDS